MSFNVHIKLFICLTQLIERLKFKKIFIKFKYIFYFSLSLVLFDRVRFSFPWLGLVELSCTSPLFTNDRLLVVQNIKRE